MHNAIRLCAHMLSLRPDAPCCENSQTHPLCCFYHTFFSDAEAQVISNIRSLALKLHNNTCFDNKAFQDTPACLGRNALQSVLLFPGLSNRGRCRLSFKGKTCCRYTILPKPSARSLWRMQSAASNLSNFKTPLILQPRAAKYFECPSSALQYSTFRSSRSVSLETPHQSAAGPIKQCSTHMHLDPAL